MKKTTAKISAILFAAFSFLIFPGNIFSWEADPTHKDITSYAVDNSVLNTNRGDYLKNLGLGDGLDEWFKWEKNMPAKDWLQEGATLEDQMNLSRCRNHFHNPIEPWGSAGLNDIFSGKSSLLWAQGQDISNDWTWQEARDRYYLALTSKTDDDREENFARTFRCLGDQMDDAKENSNFGNISSPFRQPSSNRPEYVGY